MRNISDKVRGENENKYFMFSNLFLFSKIVPLGDNVENYGTAGEATDDKMAHVHFMLNI